MGYKLNCDTSRDSVTVPVTLAVTAVTLPVFVAKTCHVTL